MLNMKLSKRLKEVRNAMNLTQEELASKVHIKKASISNYENEYSTPSYEVLLDLSRVLGVSTDYLLGNNVKSAQLTTVSEPQVVEQTKKIKRECLSNE